MPAQDHLPGKLGPYRLQQQIGAGGMGVVYLARDTEGRPVAIKVLGPAVTSDPNARRRLAREVETMRRVRSPFVAEILDADVTGDAPYIVTRYVPGSPLDQVIRQSGPIRGAALARLAGELSEALIAIHAAGVVHRDLKPGNVMIVEGHPVVIDFGIAHIGDATRLTQTGMVMGTPGYLAPEVIEGQPSSDASDMHSWGATIAYAATGRSPYGTGTFQTIFYRVVTGRPDLTGVPVALLPLVAAALGTNPALRPPADWVRDHCMVLATACANDPHALDSPAMAPVLPAFATPTIQDGRGVTIQAGGPAGVVMGPNGTLIAAQPEQAPLAQAPLAQAPLAQPLPAPAQPSAPLPSPREAAPDVADLLPPRRPEQLTQDRPATGQPAKADPAAPAKSRNRPASYAPVTAAIVVIAVAMSILLPEAGTLIALGVITLLRATEHAGSSLARRRAARGVRPSDLLVVIMTAPLTVLTAVLTMVALAPVALVIGAIAAIAATVMLRTHTLPAAGAWAAGAIVLWYAVGPGSGKPRRQLNRLLGAVVRTRGAFVVAIIAAVALAGAAVSQATSQPPLYWPLTPSMLPHVPSVSHALGSTEHWLLSKTDHFIPHIHWPHIP
jgi:predicted Ser/Thr protein kinase